MKASNVALSLIFAASSLLASPLAHAIQEGHGGGGYDCGKKGVFFLDLKEAELGGIHASQPLKLISTTYALGPQIGDAIYALRARSEDLASMVAFVISRFLGEDWHNLKSVQELDPRKSKIVFWGDEVEIPFPEDVSESVDIKGCRRVGIAVYGDDGGGLRISRSLFMRMPVQHQSALLFHEAIYFVLRMQLSERTSIRARALTAYAFTHADLNQVAGLRSDRFKTATGGEAISTSDPNEYWFDPTRLTSSAIEFVNPRQCSPAMAKLRIISFTTRTQVFRRTLDLDAGTRGEETILDLLKRLTERDFQTTIEISLVDEFGAPAPSVCAINIGGRNDNPDDAHIYMPPMQLAPGQSYTLHLTRLAGLFSESAPRLFIYQ